MPAVPKRKISKRRGANRRNQSWALQSRPPYVYCQYCGAPKRPHHVCPACGVYRGQQVITVEEE